METGIDLSTLKTVHFVGIKGIAMAALAVVARDLGFSVSGSDIAGSFPSDDTLAVLGTTVYTGFSAEHITAVHPDLVIYTGAHNGKENPEVLEAANRGIPVLPHGKALGLFMEGKRRISVAGCHGKTTTSAMVATIFVRAKKDPSYAVGCGTMFPIGLPGHGGKGPWFIAEADEYVTDPMHDPTPRFLWQNPDVLCITNIDYDHPDAYKTLDDVKKAYETLARHVPSKGSVVINGDDGESAFLSASCNPITVGRGESCMWRITDETFSPGHTAFVLSGPANQTVSYSIAVPGSHNVINAAMAAVTSMLAGCTAEETVDGLAVFTGTMRRFQQIGEAGGVLFYDDYAHHPHEIAATVSAAKLWYPHARLFVIFEPHTYSRTKALLDEFAGALARADIPVVSDIYASAREHDTLGITAADIVAKIVNVNPSAVYKKDAGEVTGFLKETVKRGDIVIFMGAGDIYHWSRCVVSDISQCV